MSFNYFLSCIRLLITSALLEFRGKCGGSEVQLIRSYKLVLLSSSPVFKRQIFSFFFLFFSFRIKLMKRLP